MAEGGFSIDAEGSCTILEADSGIAYYRTSGEISGVVNLLNFKKHEIIFPEANTNLNYPRTALPTLLAEFEPGTYVFASAILGEVGNDICSWGQDVPHLMCEGNLYTAKYLNKEVKITL